MGPIQSSINQGIALTSILKTQSDLNKEKEAKAKAQAQKEKAKVEAKEAKAKAQAQASLELERAKKRQKHVDFTKMFLEGTGVNAFDYLNKEGKQ